MSENLMNKIRILSLFSGAGGLDIGFHQEGFLVKACIELEKDACDTLELNRGKYLSKETKIYCKDITKLLPEKVKADIGEIDFMIGGPPCQSFSAAGRRAGGVPGINDTRGSLFWYYAQYLRCFKPKGFLFENVKGILQANKSKDWEIIKESFRELGYNLSYKILDAADYGTPQHRERVIMVGQLSDLPFRFPRPTFGPNSKDAKPYYTPREAFSDIDDVNEIVPVYSGKYGHLLKDIPPGLNYSFYTERMGHEKPLFAWRSKFSGFLYKLDPDEPSKTLVAHQGKYDGPFHWKSRKLKIDELVRIQGFPTDYILSGSRISMEKQIGNSVAPKLGRYLAQSVLKQIFGRKEHPVALIDADDSIIRKKKSRVIRANFGSIEKNNCSQLRLFDDAINWPNEKISLDLHKSRFSNNCTLKNGEWIINVKKLNSKNLDVTFSVSLDFSSAIGKSFKGITCNLKSSDLNDFNVTWDFIHRIVKHSCSYDSLQPLYGHFTEPYPKFVTTISSNRSKNAIFVLMKKMSEYTFLAKNHDYNLMYEIFGKKIDILTITRYLRSKGVDIRIHETNRTIPKNQFKICYPFTIPSWQPTYTKWVDAGMHTTSDLNIINLMTGVNQ